MRRLFIIGLTAIALTANAEQNKRAETFPISSVRLTDSQFLRNQQADIHYLLGLDADRLLAPYLKGAGLTPKAENYTNWENTGLDGHIGGHYVSALSYMLAATGNQEICARFSELKRCQDAREDGYLGGVPNPDEIWGQIAKGDIRANSFGLNNRWVPLYNIHKIYAGLRDAYLVAGREEAKEMLIKLTDWMIQEVSQLSDDQIQQMLISEQGGLNETFADVYAITGDKKYLRLAHQFSDQKMLQPLLHAEDNLTGKHANTQIPKVIGYKRIADLVLNNGTLLEMHDCGKCDDFIPDWLDIGVVAWNPAQAMNDLKGVKEKFGRRIVICGGWNGVGPESEVDYPEEAFREKLKEYVDTLAPGGGFVFSCMVNGSFKDPKVQERMKIVGDFYNDYVRDWYKTH